MLYTRKGDKGTTTTFGCNQRISKSSAIAEALGSLDETNSFLGLCKVNATAQTLELAGAKYAAHLHRAQEALFIVQAELAGAEGKSVPADRVAELEQIVDQAEKEMPPIKSFFIPGGTELAALLDVARTTVRRAERRVIAVHDEAKARGEAGLSEHSLAYLNRLSSLFYAMARYANFRLGVGEQAPSYK